MIQKAPSDGNTNTEYKNEIFIPKYVMLVYVRGAQIPGTSQSGTLNFGEWCLVFVSPQYGTCSVSHFWYLQF